VPGRLHAADLGSREQQLEVLQVHLGVQGQRRFRPGGVVPQVLRRLLAQEPQLVHARRPEHVEAQRRHPGVEAEDRLRPLALRAQHDLDVAVDGGRAGALHRLIQNAFASLPAGDDQPLRDTELEKHADRRIIARRT